MGEGGWGTILGEGWWLGPLFWVGEGGWVNILDGWGWVGMSGSEWGLVHCLIIPILNRGGPRTDT